MNKSFYILVSILTVFFAGSLPTAAQPPQPDLSMRTALYFTGSKTDKIDLATDKYVASGATMVLNKSQATSCDSSGCTYNIGFIASRSGYTRGELSTYGLFEVGSGDLVGNTVFFGFPDKTKQGVHALKLKLGLNKVTFTIDPYKKTDETNENNNTFSVNFKVVSDMSIDKKGIIPKN